MAPSLKSQETLRDRYRVRERIGKGGAGSIYLADDLRLEGRLSALKEDEYDRALAWTKANCQEGKDYNDDAHKRTRQQLDADWEMSVKMALIARDLMVGNPRLEELGFKEEANGHNALAGGFQGQRQWTDTFANGDFMEAILNTSFDWNGIRQ
ncbi:MAG: hypothetical protein ACK2T0_02740, partial [Anaerolineales bacterium]